MKEKLITDYRGFIQTASDEELEEKYRKYLLLIRNGIVGETPYKVFLVADILAQEIKIRYWERLID